MNLLKRAALVVALGAAVVAAVGAYLAAPDAQAAVGGPVILGGDDLTSHGCQDAGANIEGWLYMQRSLENIAPNVTRSNDGSVAALGSASVDGAVSCGDAGSAIYHAAAAAGLTVTYYNGGPEIEAFFASLTLGDVDPAIIWIAGDDGSNDLGDDATEPAALIANAADISDFVNGGGGLMSHGVEYGWLTALLPLASTVDGGCDDCGDLYFTPDGTSELSPLDVSNINAGPWHNHFEGDLGGLKVLARSNEIDDNTGEDAAVIIGGAQVTIEEQPDEDEPDATSTPCIPPLVTYRCDGTSGGGGGAQPTVVPPTAAVPAGTVVPGATPASSPVAPAQPTSPSGGQGGVILAPDTGDGSGTTGGSAGLSAMLLMTLAGVGVALGIAGALTRRGVNNR